MPELRTRATDIAQAVGLLALAFAVTLNLTPPPPDTHLVRGR